MPPRGRNHLSFLMSVSYANGGMNYDLIIFDCDGTLVDSEYLCNKIIVSMLAEFGLPQYDVGYAMKNFVGLSAPVAFERVAVESGKKLPSDVVKIYERRVNENMAEGLRFIDGVPETLAELHEAFDMCVGSNGERSTVLLSLQHAGISHYFPEHAVFTKAQVVNPKPAPDLYFLAAREMGADPTRTLVVEDSVAGVKAGKAAGMRTIGLTATYHDKESHGVALRSAGADHVIDRFIHIADCLG